MKLILALLAIAVVAYVVLRRRGGRVGTDVVRTKLAAGARVLDVRTPEEFRQGAYPGAVNIPVQELPRRMGEVPRDVPLVVYCAAGGRAAAAVAMLQRAGYADVVNAGGLASMPR